MTAYQSGVADGAQKLSVVIPAYKAAQRIKHLLNETLAVCKTIALPFEIIVVDDRSPDETWQAISSVQNQHPGFITAYRPKNNLGQYGATILGITKSTGSLIVTMDDDFSPAPIELTKLLAARKQAALVYGSIIDAKRSWLRTLASNIIHAFIKVATGNKNLAMGSSFRLFSRQLWNEAEPTINVPEKLDVALLNAAKNDVHFVAINWPKHQNSSHSPLQLIILACRIIGAAVSHGKTKKAVNAEPVEQLE